MARVELPESRLKVRKRRRRLRVSSILGGFLVAVLIALTALAHIPALQIQSVLVSGTQTIASTTIVRFVNDRLDGNYYFLFPKRNIFLYPKQAIAKDIMAAYPAISSADVHANDFESIAVLVVERSPRALWCVSPGEASGCYFLDENGVVYGTAPTFSEPIYIRYSGAMQGRVPWQFLTPADFQSLAALVDAIAQKLNQEQVSYVSIDGAQDVRIAFASGFSLRFALNDPGGDTFERLTLALESEPFKGHSLSEFEYLDLRFGDKLYYKHK